LKRIVGLSLSVCLAGLQGCGNEESPGEPVAWNLGMGKVSGGGGFGVRIILDGEPVYERSDVAQAAHVVDVVRPYGSGSHRLEFEILAAQGDPGLYAAGWSYRLENRAVHADGAPTPLAVGQRLTINVDLSRSAP
jgi:hypothetical protein